MNERIKELAEEAGIFKPEQFYQHIDALQLEKFAGLLIKECAEIVKDSPWKLGHSCAASDQALLILEHFGVKE